MNSSYSIIPSAFWSASAKKRIDLVRREAHAILQVRHQCLELTRIQRLAVVFVVALEVITHNVLHIPDVHRRTHPRSARSSAVLCNALRLALEVFDSEFVDIRRLYAQHFAREGLQDLGKLLGDTVVHRELARHGSLARRPPRGSD